MHRQEIFLRKREDESPDRAQEAVPSMGQGMRIVRNIFAVQTTLPDDAQILSAVEVASGSEMEIVGI